jgi:hypothetical protein
MIFVLVRGDLVVFRPKSRGLQYRAAARSLPLHAASCGPRLLSLLAALELLLDAASSEPQHPKRRRGPPVVRNMRGDNRERRLFIHATEDCRDLLFLDFIIAVFACDVEGGLAVLKQARGVSGCVARACLHV